MYAEIAILWVSIFAYATSSVLHAIGWVFRRERLFVVADLVALVGLAAHAVSIGVRWVRIGHGPYLGFFEVASLLSFMSVAFFLLLVLRHPGVRVIGVVVMPVAFMILGASMLASKEPSEVAGNLASIWLVIHVIFANLAYGSYIVAFGLSAAYLLRSKPMGERVTGMLDRLPAQEVLDAVTYRFVGLGFIFQGAMIATGAVWANEAWGRYWGWDPMETWSLIAWAIYALYLHLALTMGWRGRKLAWVAVIALPVIVFSLLGVPVVYESIHGAYLAL